MSMMHNSKENANSENIAMEENVVIDVEPVEVLRTEWHLNGQNGQNNMAYTEWPEAIEVASSENMKRKFIVK